MANSIGGQVHVDGSSADLRNEQANSESTGRRACDYTWRQGFKFDYTWQMMTSNQSSQSRHKWPDATGNAAAAGWMAYLRVSRGYGIELPANK